MSNPKPSGRNELRKAFGKAAPYLSIGYSLMGAVILFAVLGNWLDNRTGRGSLFLIIGVFTGFFLGLYRMIKVINELEKKDKNG